MATSDHSIGRQEAIGLGIEATPGTPVAPQIWLRWLNNEFQPKTQVIENESAMGVVDRVNDSAVVAKWAEGSVGGKLTSHAAGFLLTGFFGTCTTGAASSGIYPHTFTVKQSATPTTLTVARKSPLSSERYSYGALDNLEISNEAGGWVEISTAIKARAGVPSTEAPDFTAEKEFTSKNVVLKIAATTGALAASTAVPASRVRVTLERSNTPYFPLGTDSLAEFDRGAFEARGEFVIRLRDTQYEEDFLANTIKAMSITMTNGTDSLAVTAGKVRYREIESTKDKDNVVTATVQFFCEFDGTSSVSVVLRNSRATYAAA